MYTWAISLSCLPKNYRPPIPAPKTHFIKKNTTAFEILCTYLKQLSMSYNAVSALELFTPEIVFIWEGAQNIGKYKVNKKQLEKLSEWYVTRI